MITSSTTVSWALKLTITRSALFPVTSAEALPAPARKITSKINDSRISKVLNQHKLICDKVYAVNENKLEASLKSDFLIMDNAFMFLNAVTSQESNLNIVSINKSTVEDYKKRFDSIKISAEEYK